MNDRELERWDQYNLLKGELDRISTSTYKEEDHAKNHQTFAKVLKFILEEIYNAR